MVAVGHGQHTMVSCDDGRTWRHNKYTDEILENSDTDHIPFGLRGAAYANGNFYLMWGWGIYTYIERSSDGVNWTTIFGVADPTERRKGSYDPSLKFGGWGLITVPDDQRVAFGNDSDIHLSSNAGNSWTPIKIANYGKVIFGYGNGLFVAHPEGSGYFYSTDLQQWFPGNAPAQCSGGRTDYIRFKNNTFALPTADRDGAYICSSVDGMNWRASAKIPIVSDLGLVFDGSRFIATDNRSVNLFGSQDAFTWTPIIGTGAIDWPSYYGINEVTGTHVVSQGSILQTTDTNGNVVRYQTSVMYRSDNGGMTFQKLPETAFDKRGGTIIRILSGSVSSDVACK
jgi:hypothetical protein